MLRSISFHLSFHWELPTECGEGRSLRAEAALSPEDARRRVVGGGGVRVSAASFPSVMRPAAPHHPPRMRCMRFNSA